MRVLLQRVRQARVSVDGKVVGQIGPGLCILAGATHTDTPAIADALAHKVATMRIFEDDAGKMNLSVLDTGGAALVVSQFTLYADTSGGRRPAFVAAARPEVAEPLIQHFAEALKREGIAQVEQGVFRAMMLVEIQNDGPVTIWVEV
jgi:D-tyrosyl-tRNA(Tyr) deacylase